MHWQIGSIYPNSELESKYKGIVWSNVGLNATSIIIMSIIFFFIISTLIKPLNKVVQIANKVAAGKLTEKVEVKTEDEIGKLGASFNDMTDGLKTMIHQVDNTAGKLNDFSHEVSASIEENLQSITQVVDNIHNIE
jgi:methyl-accepting chemotaxis protein